MNISEKIINNIIGSKQSKDSDMDGVPDNKDCQPNNIMRQDYIQSGGAQRLQQLAGKTKKSANKSIRGKI